MTFFTSINNYYLAKARVLAKTIKKYNPDSYFILILSDKIPENFNLKHEPFDELITIEELDLPLENKKLWIYFHSVVELCTAVKGQALYQLLQKHDKVAYIDPDILVVNELKEIDNLLDQYDIIFTPHSTIPEEEDVFIKKLEIVYLNRGTYNFGFFAVRSNDNGKKFAKYYRDRLLKYCKDDEANGLFTDQKWGDLAPALFNNLYIWKHHGANTSHWNLVHRNITFIDNKYFIDDQPLLFFHFSGFDSGAQLDEINYITKGKTELHKLFDYYKNEQEKNGQLECIKSKSFYDYYSNGIKISINERRYLRENINVLPDFINNDPYKISDNCYYSWYINEVKTGNINDFSSLSKNEIIKEYLLLKTKYNNIIFSKAWRFANKLRNISYFFKRLFKHK